MSAVLCFLAGVFNVLIGSYNIVYLELIMWSGETIQKFKNIRIISVLKNQIPFFEELFLF